MSQTTTGAMTSTTTFPSRSLWTKDGSKVGNAILYGTEPSKHVEGLTINLVETDFGNRMRLTATEIEAWWVIGAPNDYAQWRADRDSVRLNNTIQDQCDAIDKEHGVDRSTPA